MNPLFAPAERGQGVRTARGYAALTNRAEHTQPRKIQDPSSVAHASRVSPRSRNSRAMSPTRLTPGRGKEGSQTIKMPGQPTRPAKVRGAQRPPCGLELPITHLLRRTSHPFEQLTFRHIHCLEAKSAGFAQRNPQPSPYRGNTKSRNTANIPKQRAPNITGRRTRNSELRFGIRRETPTPISRPTKLEPTNIRITESSPAIPSSSPPK